ncbi:MAG: hypothetical protein MJ166_06945 [Clostridia bacterium]|nr:hypothetical protein [Clostridia bacterium]
MKKLIATLVCACMLTSTIALAGCSETKEDTKEPAKNEQTDKDDASNGDSDSGSNSGSGTDETAPLGDTLGAKIYGEFLSRIDSTSDIEKVAEELATEEITGYSCGYMTVEEGLLNGFTDEIKGFKSGVVFSPMIGSVPFVAYIFESDDPSALKSTLLEKCDPRWNICTEADETFCEVHGNYVFFIMCPAE